MPTASNAASRMTEETRNSNRASEMPAARRWGTTCPTPAPATTGIRRGEPGRDAPSERSPIAASERADPSVPAPSAIPSATAPIRLPASTSVSSAHVAAAAPAASPSADAQSARSWMCSEFPQLNTPGTLVWNDPSTLGPPVAGSLSQPSMSASLFSGMRPTDSTSVSHSMRRSVPGMGWRVLGSTDETHTASSRRAPSTRVTVEHSVSGMPKSSRHWTMLRRRPDGCGMISWTPTTSMPSSVIRRAMMSPMSPEPSTTARRPGMQPCRLMSAWADPAV